MEINKTTVYKLSKEDIQGACYSLFVEKLKGLDVNAYFKESDIKMEGYGDGQEGDFLDIWAELKITEKEDI